MKIKVQMMEESKSTGDAAAHLVQQFIDAGIVAQDEEGSFTVPGVSQDRKFQAFSSVRIPEGRRLQRDGYRRSGGLN